TGRCTPTSTLATRWSSAAARFRTSAPRSGSWSASWPIRRATRRSCGRRAGSDSSSPGSVSSSSRGSRRGSTRSIRSGGMEDEAAALRESLERANEEQRELRPELPGGIGGSTRTGSLKCLHAHAAFALARPGYELGERVLAELDHLWPDSGCCSAE